MSARPAIESAPGNTEHCGLCGEQYCDSYDADGDPVHEDCFPATVLAMAEQAKKRGRGRPREIDPDGAERARNVTLRLGSAFEAELDALVEDAGGAPAGATRSSVVRAWLEASARRRARRG